MENNFIENGYIDVKSDAWQSLIAIILDKYNVGDMIEHDWLKKKFSLKKPLLQDFKTQEEFEDALNIYEFAYMSLVDRLRSDLLENEKYYLKNIRGEGYILLPPKEQTEFAAKKIKYDIKKTLSDGTAILTNIRISELPIEARQQNTDALARLGFLKQVLKVNLID